MKLERIVTSEIGTNTYILHSDGEAFVIDPGVWSDVVSAKLSMLGLQCTKVLLTHGHYDHTMATAVLAENGAKVYVYYTEEALNNEKDSLARHHGLKYTPYRPSVLLHDGENINFANMQFHVLHTPGHTSGGICLIGDGVIFSGDTLFKDGVGRTDLPTGDAVALHASIQKLFSLKGDYIVYPGHGAETSLDYERMNNFY